MPKYVPRPRTTLQRFACAVVCGAVIIGVGYALYRYPIQTSLAVLGIAALCALHSLEHRVRLKRLARSRAGHSICEFRAAFDPHVVDPWVIRAVYEQVQGWLGHAYPDFPLHAEDRLEKDLLIDGDDLSFELAEEISQRTGRSLEHPAAQAWTTPVITAGDLVFYFNQIPNDSQPQGSKSTGAA